MHGPACAAWRACRVPVACDRPPWRQVLRHGLDRRVPGRLQGLAQIPKSGRARDRLACRGRSRAGEDFASLLPGNSKRADIAKLGLERHGERDRTQGRRDHRSCDAVLSHGSRAFGLRRRAGRDWLFGATMTGPTRTAEVLNAIRASMATFGSDAMVIAGSSPYARRGVLWDAFRRWHGKDDARNLVWQAATRVMNPTISQEFIDEEYERDPASAAAEYGANFRSDVAEFVDLAVLEACTADGLFELPPVSGTAYLAFCDPSGGSSDSMTLAIAHHDDGVAVLDCVREVRAPFQPEAVVEDFCATLAAYGVAKVTGDRYAGEWPREQFRKRNVDYIPSERVKSLTFTATCCRY